MQPGLPSSLQALRLDARSLIAAGLCLLAPFFDVFGWVLAIAGIVVLRRATFSSTTKWLLAATAIAPKILFLKVQAMNAPQGLSFPIEPWNLATSSSLWAWCILLVALGAILILQPRRPPQAPDAPVQPLPPRSLLTSVLGLVLIAIAAVLLLGLTDSFHRIDDAGQGRWALRHAARGNIAVFSGSQIENIVAVERRRPRAGRDYQVSVALVDGRSFSLTTKSSGVLEELRKFATTANLSKGKVCIIRRYSGRWINGEAGFTLKDFVGTYELTEESSRSRITFEFWMDGERLTGKETVADPGGRHVRVLKNIKVNDRGDVEFQPATFIDASQQAKGTVSLSFGWSPDGETGRFVKNGLEVGPRKYRKQ